MGRPWGVVPVVLVLHDRLYGSLYGSLGCGTAVGRCTSRTGTGIAWVAVGLRVVVPVQASSLFVRWFKFRILMIDYH